MEIIHIILGKANPDRLNGVNKVVYQLASAQAEANMDVQVWGFTAQPVHDYPDRNFKTLLFQSYKNPFKLPANFLLALEKNKQAIFHIHGGWVPLFYSISALLSKNELPYVFTPHGAYNNIAMKKSYWIKKLYFHFFEKKLIKNANKIHCLGASEVDGLEQLMSGKKTVLIPYGYEGDFNHEFAASSTVFTVGYMGRLDIHTKGLDLLVEAFSKLSKKYSNTRLWIIGDSDERAYLSQKCEQLGISNVKWWGKQFGDDKRNIMKQFDVFAHPSRNEGLPSAIMEAAAMSTPLLITQATNMASYVEAYNAGLVIHDNDATELYQALEQFYMEWNQTHLMHIRANALKMVKACFSWSKLVQRYNKELYTSML